MAKENMPSKSSRTGLYIGAVIIIVVIIVVGVVAYELSMTGTNPSPSSTGTPAPSGSATTMSVYGGEISNSQYGFGSSNSKSSLSSPGPQLTLKVGQTYTMTFYNIGQLPHGWEITSAKTAGTALFGAGIGVSSYISPGQSASVTFTPNQSGNFYYVCTVPGHAELGMWGNVVVNP